MTAVREPEHAQHIGDGHERGRPFPRGVALSLHVDRETGVATGWSLVSAASGEVMRYAVAAELDDPAKAPDLDAAYRAAEATIAEARRGET